MDATITRTEFKFLLTEGQYDDILPEIRTRLPGDRNALRGEYPIVTEYFDNPWRDCYWERLRALRNRRKLRVRIYGSADGQIPPKAFAEVKHKAYGRGVKRRFDLPVAAVVAPGFSLPETLRREAPARGRDDQVLAEEMLRLMEEREMWPVCQMRYSRLAFEGTREDDVRVTFDRRICCRADLLPLCPDCRDFEHELLPEGSVLMEVKMNGVAPYWVRDLIGRHRLVRRKFSKYCTALEHFGLRPPQHARTASPAAALVSA